MDLDEQIGLMKGFLEWKSFVCRRLCCCGVTKSCPTLCDLMDGVAHQVALSMGFPRQEWVGISSSRGIFLAPGIERKSPVSPALASRYFFFTIEPPGKPMKVTYCGPI